MLVVLRLYVLDSLSMVLENVDSHNRMIKFWIGGLKDFIVYIFFVIQSIKSFEQKLKNCFEVLWRRCSYKNVAEAVYNTWSNSYSQTSRFTTAASSSKANCSF